MLRFLSRQSIANSYAQVLRGAVEKQEHDYGSTHVMIDPWSAAATSLNMARDAIRDEDCMATGKDVDPNHITVRYGLLNEDLDALRTFLATLSPFEAQVTGIELFPASEHSDGAVPVVARIESPGLHLVEAAIGGYADFKEKSFPEYKPHCTLAYVTQASAPSYADLPVGGTCLVHSVTISHASGTQETIPFGGTHKFDPNEPRDDQGQWTAGGSSQTEYPPIQDYEEAWAGGVGDLGDPDAGFLVQNHPQYDAYQADLHKELTEKYGSSITVYRAVTEDGYEDMKGGAALGPMGVTTDLDLAKNWAKFALNTGNTYRILKTTIAPKIAVLRGKEEESEIVIDGDLTSFHEWEQIGTATDKGGFVPVKKADPAGRYVTPFVSFDKQGDDQLRMIASLNSSRLATWGFTAEAEAKGLARYRITAVLDGRTSEFCRFIDGKIFDVTDAREKVIDVLNVQDPEDLRVVQPWPKQTKQAMADFREMDNDELVDMGLHIPPYHPYCRTILRPVGASEGDLEEEDQTPEVPDEIETFQPVTMADLAELGVEATQDEVDDWNAHVGMSPVELLAKLAGMAPKDVMEDGVGSKAIQFDEDGNIAFNPKGDVNGVEFKVGALLDPFTGIYYLTQADLATGTPSAEAGFLKQMFTALIDMVESSPTATALALNVAGNAAYYAKLGFLPDEVEWDGIRQYALDGLETDLQPMIASLAPEDQELVKHLLQDRSPEALSALVELPFTYEGKTIGEHILEQTGGTWELDLTDPDVVDHAKAYLS